MSVLSKREMRTAVAVCDTIFPAGASAAAPLGASNTRIEAFVEDIMATYPPAMVKGIRALLLVLDVAALTRRGSRYASLAPEVREALYEKWSGSRVYMIRQGAMTFRALAALGYCGDPDVREAIGYVKARAVPSA